MTTLNDIESQLFWENRDFYKEVLESYLSNKINSYELILICNTLKLETLKLQSDLNETLFEIKLESKDFGKVMLELFSICHALDFMENLSNLENSQLRDIQFRERVQNLLLKMQEY
jgi:hypothetical protein